MPGNRDNRDRGRYGGQGRPGAREGGWGKPSGGYGRPREGGFGGSRAGPGGLREKFFHKARKKMEEFRAREDLFLMEVDRAIDDLDKSINLYGERLEEWLAYYVSGVKVADKDKLAKLIIVLSENKEPSRAAVAEAVGENAADAVLAKLSNRTQGVKEKDLVYMRKYAEEMLRMVELDKFYGEEIDSLANRIAPNATFLVGGKVVAKMVSLAKGLDRLAKMPASTIQMLGAEKALFAFLKGGKKGDPPKHGVILFSPQVSSVKRENRGKMARTLAAKLAIAFRIDDAKGAFYGKELKEAIDRRQKSLM